jgi:hypothetical protein
MVEFFVVFIDKMDAIPRAYPNIAKIVFVNRV